MSAICDDFRRQWMRAVVPRLEDYLLHFGPPEAGVSALERSFWRGLDRLARFMLFDTPCERQQKLSRRFENAVTETVNHFCFERFYFERIYGGRRDRGEEEAEYRELLKSVIAKEAVILNFGKMRVLARLSENEVGRVRDVFESRGGLNDAAPVVSAAGKSLEDLRRGFIVLGPHKRELGRMHAAISGDPWLEGLRACRDNPSFAWLMMPLGHAVRPLTEACAALGRLAGQCEARQEYHKAALHVLKSELNAMRMHILEEFQGELGSEVIGDVHWALQMENPPPAALGRSGPFLASFRA